MMEHDAGEGRSPHSSGINLQPLANDVPARIENPKDLLGEALKLVFDSSSPVFVVSPFAMDRKSLSSWNPGATP